MGAFNFDLEILLFEGHTRLQVGHIAINDGIILRNHISRILKTHFRQSPIYVELVDLFNDVSYLDLSFSTLLLLRLCFLSLIISELGSRHLLQTGSLRYHLWSSEY